MLRDPHLFYLLLFCAGALFLWLRSSRRSGNAATRVVRNQTVKSRSATRWIVAGEAVNCQQTQINAGLFYCGEAVQMGDGRALTQYAINPRLPASTGKGDVDGSTMPYWPSYADITPYARRAFLNWMAAGRKTPIGIGHVFIFFYGLEHRLFAEAKIEDAPLLLAEIDRLLAIYGGNGSFRGYAEKFRSCVGVVYGLTEPSPALSPVLCGGFEIPLSVRRRIGKAFTENGCVQADDALLWLLSLPGFRLKTAAVRCFDQLKTLWTARFQDEFPGGYRTSFPGEKMSVRYRAASGAFEVTLPGPHTDYPDIASLAGGPEELQRLLDQCTEELEPFSRFIGKNPQQKSSLEASLLLPPPLRNGAVKQGTGDLVRKITGLMGGRGTATAPLRDLVEACSLGTSRPGQTIGVIADQLGATLDVLDIAMVPDRRYGDGTPSLDDFVVIFSAQSGGPVDPAGSVYKSTKMRVEVAALAAISDDVANADELQAIIATIRSASSLGPVERLRLIGYAVSIFKSPPKKEKILRRLSETDKSEKKEIAAAAAAVVGLQSHADPRSIRFLEKLHKTLKLPQDEVYTNLHRSARIDAPVSVSTERRTPGIRLPSGQSIGPAATVQEKLSIQIDRARLSNVQRDTAAVAKILSGIFVDESPSASASTPANASNTPYAGLDLPHAQLVTFLQESGRLSRRIFEDRAKQLRLLPDGAIERINDWFFDKFDEPLLEDSDDIVVSPHLREKLAELREARV